MAAAAAGGKTKRLATLVGCNYPNTRHELRGCINDVRAMRDLLLSRFDFLPDDVVILTDDNAADSPMLPTGANILRALADMISRAAPGDVLFFHYSGHGTLIPPVKPHHSWSKRDEAIVPCDFNLITDVDFRQLVDSVPAGATFTMVSDSCHSGGLIDREKEQIGPSTIITDVCAGENHRARRLPFESVLSHLAALSGVASPHVGDHLAALFGAAASAKYSSTSATDGSEYEAPRGDQGILLSGCQADETSADMSPFEEGTGGKAYGAFSSALRLVLGGAVAAAMSNREVVTGAREVLRAQGFAGQHPCLYCGDANADVPFLEWEPSQQTHQSALDAVGATGSNTEADTANVLKSKLI